MTTRSHGEDALLALLSPGWRLVLGVAVALAVVAAGWRLLRRGPSRMVSGMVIALGVIALLVLLTLLFGG